MKNILFLFFVIILLIFGSPVLAAGKISVRSASFSNKDIIPDKHACDILGSNLSPPFTFTNIPANTESLALVMDDPDAPGGSFNHWVIFNIPLDDSGLEEGILSENEFENGIIQGTNGTEQIGYFGPCPPPFETHRYVFSVFALDTVLDLEDGATKKQLLKAMRGHILGRGKLVGKYKNNTNF